MRDKHRLLPGGNLADLLSCSGVRLSWTTLLTLAMQVGSALQYLHGQGPRAIVHTDVKASNILYPSSLPKPSHPDNQHSYN